MVLIPDSLVRATREREGSRGREWLQNLPGIISRCLEDWNCAVDGPPWHGETSIVIPVRRGQELYALKVGFPHPDNQREAAVLRRFDGQGAIRVFNSNEVDCALLLERAETRTLHSVPLTEAIERAGDLARRLAIPAEPADPSLADLTAGWLEQLDRQMHDAPGLVPRGVTDQARDTIRMLAEDGTTTLLHGDLHLGNVLDAKREPWLVIDPNGLRGTAAYDAFTVVAGGRGSFASASNVEAVVRGRIDRFASSAGVGSDIALACTQARATSSYLHQQLTNGDWFDVEFLRGAMALR